MSVAVLDAMQELDQQIALARGRPKQRADLDQRLRIDGTSLRMAADAAFAAERRRIDDRDFAHARPPRGCVRSRPSRVMASVEEVAIFFDMRGKVQRVLAYQRLGKLGIRP